jgi:hypothetical protein
MSISIKEFVDVEDRAMTLDCEIPTGLSLLPRNFSTAESKDELIHESSVTTVRTLFSQNQLHETRLEKDGDRFNRIVERGNDWIAPTLFLTASLLMQNPNVTALAINIISNYLTDLFKGIPGRKNIRLDVVVEKQTKKTYMKINYEGDIEGMSEIPNIVQKVFNDES